MDKQILAVVGAIIAGVISLVVAGLNLRATARLQRAQRNFDLLKRDLDRLEEANAEVNSVILPSLPSAERLKELQQTSPETLKRELQDMYDKIQPGFEKISTIILRNKALFSKEEQEKIVELFTLADGRASGLTLGRRIEFITYVQNAIDKQIAQIREQWRIGE